MKRFLVVLVMMVMLVFVPAAPASADPDGCIVNVQGPIAVVICGGAVVGNLPLPTVTVSAPPVTLPPIKLPPAPPVTKFIQGPTKTATVTVPGPTKTVQGQPGGMETKYVTKAPQTVTKSPNTSTFTVTKSVDGPTATVTQIETKTVKVDKPSGHNVLFDPPPLTVKGAVGYSLLAILLICGLIILGLWLGYILGYKDSERSERKFLEALRDQFYYKGNHS